MDPDDRLYAKFIFDRGIELFQRMDTWKGDAEDGAVPLQPYGVFPLSLAYYRGTALRGVGRFLLDQFLRALPRYDTMDGDPLDGAIPAAYFGTRRFCGTKGEGNAFWLQRLSRGLVEYRIQEVEPEAPEGWVDFRDWNQGMHVSGKVFDLGVIGYQIYGGEVGWSAEGSEWCVPSHPWCTGGSYLLCSGRVRGDGMHDGRGSSTCSGSGSQYLEGGPGVYGKRDPLAGQISEN